MSDMTPGEQRQQEIQGKLQEQQALAPGQLGLEEQKNQLELEKQGQLYGMQVNRDKEIEGYKANIAGEKPIREATAKAKIDLPKTISTGVQSIALLDALKKHKGLSDVVGVPSLTGGLLGGKIIPGTDAADFNARLNQTKGQAFLQVFEQLRGTGAITDTEGEKGTQAVARLDKAQKEEEFIKSAEEIQALIKTGIDRARAMAKGDYSAPEQPATQQAQPIVQVSPSTGKRRISYDGGNTWQVQ